MTILELDRGNSRLKWRLQDGEGHSLCRGAVAGEDFRQIGQILSKYPPPQRIRIADVTDKQSQQRLNHWCVNRWQLQPQFARTVASIGGVRCGYRSCSELGVDRWLALLAARQRLGSRTAIIVDCGSALTVDCLTTAGSHLGGYIAPGLLRLQQELFSATAIASTDSAGFPAFLADCDPADHTAAAVARGCLLMLTATVNLAIERCCRLLAEADCTLLLTGGDSELLAKTLSVPTGIAAVQLCPDLVLEGLAIAVP